MDAESAYRVAFWVLFVGVLAMRAIFALQVRRAGERLLPDQQAVEREGRGMFAVRLIGFFLIVGWLVAYALDPYWMRAVTIELPGWLRWTGFALGIVFLGLWIWAQVALGTHWSAQLQVRENHHLVTTGPYARVRHPLYTAMTGWAAGLALVSANWVFIALTLLSVAGVVARVPREERMMVATFGDEYRAYMKRTGRYLPRLTHSR